MKKAIKSLMAVIRYLLKKPSHIRVFGWDMYRI